MSNNIIIITTKVSIYDGRLRRNAGSKAKSRAPAAPPPGLTPLKVTVYDTSAVLPVSRDLAARYTCAVTRDPAQLLAMCEDNAEVARELGMQHTQHVWQLVSQVVTAARTMDGVPGSAPWSRWVVFLLVKNRQKYFLGYENILVNQIIMLNIS